MTHEEFKEICLREYPKIEGMVKMVKALGVEKVSCDVYADGYTLTSAKRTSRPIRHGMAKKSKTANSRLSNTTKTINHGGRRNAITTMRLTMTASKTTFPYSKNSALMPETRGRTKHSSTK